METKKSKLLLNNGKRLELLSDNGRYMFVSKMKVDYDAVSGIFGARDWIFYVKDLIKNINVNLQSDGEDVFKYRKYQYKKQLLEALSSAGCFNEALLEIKNK